jgi:hypothetical protein
MRVRAFGVCGLMHARKRLGRTDPSVSSIDHKNISGPDSGAFTAAVTVIGGCLVQIDCIAPERLSK